MIPPESSSSNEGADGGAARRVSAPESSSSSEIADDVYNNNNIAEEEVGGVIACLANLAGDDDDMDDSTGQGGEMVMDQQTDGTLALLSSSMECDEIEGVVVACCLDTPTLVTAAVAEEGGSPPHHDDRQDLTAGRRRGMDPPECSILERYMVDYERNNEKHNIVVTASKKKKKEEEEEVEDHCSRPSPRDGGRELVSRKIQNPPSTPSSSSGGFDHCYVIVPRKDRLSALFATLRRYGELKVVVVCSTRESCRYHSLLFRQLEMARICELREEEKEDDDNAHDEFANMYPGILFATESSMVEFDVPHDVDYVVQYEPPADPAEYVYRMNNSSANNIVVRSESRSRRRRALLFLTPDEIKFVEYYLDKTIDAAEELEARKVSKFHRVVERLVSKHDELHDCAWDAYRSFVIATKNHPCDGVYDRAKMDEGDVARSFGLLPPRSGDRRETSSNAAAARPIIVAKKDHHDDEARAVVASEATTTTTRADGRKNNNADKSESGGSGSGSGSGGRKAHWMKTEKTWRERNGGQRKSWTTTKDESEQQREDGQQHAAQKADQWRAHFGTEKTWRTGHKTKSWMAKEKTWKHSDVHL